MRKRQIAGAALEIIAARGLRHFTAREIGRALGLTDAAVFRHLPSKRAIVQAAIDRVEQLLFEGFPPVHPDPVARLGLFFERRAAVVAGQAGVARLLFSEDLAHAGGPAESARVQAFKRKSAAFVTSCLQEARDSGRLAAGIDARDAAVVVMGALMAFLLAPHGQGSSPGAQEARRLWGVLESVLFRNYGTARQSGRSGAKIKRGRGALRSVTGGE